jgi:hypothetical protein
MNLFGYTIYFDALLARIVYRWRVQSIVSTLLLIALCGLGSGLIPPFWNGHAALVITAAPGATIQVDGHAWPFPLYAGQHSIRAIIADGRGAWANVTIRANETLTITLPAGLPQPRERALPPSAPGTHIEQVWWADGAWRVLSAPNISTPATNARADGPTPTPPPGQTVAVGPQGVERLSTLDAYAGLADQVHIKETLVVAVYRPERAAAYSGARQGSIEVRGWDTVAQTFPISASLTLLRFAPDGQSLFEAEQIAGGGWQAYLIQPNQPRAPLVAVPGRIVRLAWHANSDAVAVHSIDGTRLTLTLVRLHPTIIAAAIADLPAERYAGAIVPLTWDKTGLLWVAPDQDGASVLWHAPLTSLIPERRSPLQARAIAQLADGALHALIIQDESAINGRYAEGTIIGETTAPRITVTNNLSGIWQDDELLLQGGNKAWILDIGDTPTSNK